MDCNENGMFYGVKTPLTGEEFNSADGNFANASGFLGIFPNKADREAKKQLKQRRAAMEAENKRVASVATDDDVVKPVGSKMLPVGDIVAPTVKKVKPISVTKDLAYAKKVMYSKNFLDDILDSTIVGGATAAANAADAEAARQEAAAKKQMGVMPDDNQPLGMMPPKKDNTLWWIIGGGLIATIAVIAIVASKSNKGVKK